jgi:hypothetical protein
MAMRRASVTLGVIGVLLVAGAGIINFTLVPILTRLPSNTDLTIHYSGTGTLLNQAALTSGDAAHVLAANVPITLDRHTKVSKIDGNTALVSDDISLNAGDTKLPNNHVFAVNRTTLNGTTPPGGAAVDPAQGLTVAFPLGPKANNNYRFYDTASRLAVPVHYVGADKRGGRPVRHYSATATGAVADPNLLTLLPTSLPKPTLADLAPILPADLQAKVGPLLPTLPATVPLSYSATTAVEVWADSQTGLPLDESIDQQVTVALTVAGQAVPLIPVLAVKAQLTHDSVTYLAKKASDAGSQLTLISVIVPVVLLVLGLVALAAAAVLVRRPIRQSGSLASPSRSPSMT